MIKEIYELLHKQPYGTDEVVNTKDIIIPYKFKQKESRPKYHKLQKAREFYSRNGHVDKLLSVSKIINDRGETKYLLANEYTRYIALVNNKASKAPIKYIEVTL